MILIIFAEKSIDWICTSQVQNLLYKLGNTLAGLCLDLLENLKIPENNVKR